MRKGSHHTEETKLKMGIARIKRIPPMLGKRHTKEAIERMRVAHSGENLSKETLEKMRISHLRENLSDEIIEKRKIAVLGENNPMFGRHQSEETKEKIRQARLKNPIKYWLGKKRPEMNGKNNPFYGKKHSAEDKRKISEALTGRKLSKEHTIKMIRGRLKNEPLNSLEKKFQEIINKNNLPYKFVGDGSFFIDRYCPDFINVNHKKIAIEIYARYWKRRGFGNIEKWKEKRSKTFAKYGWSMFFFDETQINEDYILKKLMKGDE